LDASDEVRFPSCAARICHPNLPNITIRSEFFSWGLRNAKALIDEFAVIFGTLIAYNYAKNIMSVRRFIDHAALRIARLCPLHLAILLIYTAIGIFATTAHLQVAMERKYGFAEWGNHLRRISTFFNTRKTENGPST
jgi:peptidoglycan/LPS O-acetylase OafA/YrhL